jgi:hypothetical protein
MKIKTDAIVKVGGGRGFVVQFEVKRGHGQTVVRIPQRNIITAAHCLPTFPPAHAGSYTQDKTYPDLIGILGKEPNVWAECLYADPIADIAVLGSPDNQELSDEAEAYETLVGSVTPLVIGEATTNGKGWMLSLDRPYCWEPTPLHLGINNLCTGPTLAGMSGSPILNARGKAIALVSIDVTYDNISSKDQNGPQPLLTRNQPGWLLDGLLFG